MACFCTIQEYQKHMETFDQNVQHITKWIIRTDELLDESEKKKLQQKEDILKVVKRILWEVVFKLHKLKQSCSNTKYQRLDFFFFYKSSHLYFFSFCVTSFFWSSTILSYFAPSIPFYFPFLLELLTLQNSKI